MDAVFPPLFLERLRQIIPQEHWDSSFKTFSEDKPLTLRINTLKTSWQEVFDTLARHQIPFKEVLWYRDAFIAERVSLNEIEKTGLIKEGKLYPQSLSSVIPVLALDPKPGEHVLDMCAAPGGKTAQMAAHMNNQGEILAVERVKNRYYRLRSVLALLGVQNASLKLTDARRLRPENLFDKILIDAPCSSEGRFHARDKKTFTYWSPRKIKEMSQKQKGLLLSGFRFLKKGGTLIYSTCTFAPEENESAIDWLLKKAGAEASIVPVSLEDVEFYPALSAWGKKTYSPQISSCLRILPMRLMEGFFIAKIVKTDG